MIGIRLPEQLIKRIKVHVNMKKKDKIYSICEFMREASEEFLKCKD